MESSHIKLHIWLQAFRPHDREQEGHQRPSAPPVAQASRTSRLGSSPIVSAKPCGLAALRLRWAATARSSKPTKPISANVEEPRISKQRRAARTRRAARWLGNKRAIVSLVERGGSVRSFHVPVADAATVAKIVTRQHSPRKRACIPTKARSTRASARNSPRTKPSIIRAKEYARGDVTTNSVEGYFSIFKRGMKGVYQHCDEKHLHRYLAEFDFRYNNRIALGVNDGERADACHQGYRMASASRIVCLTSADFKRQAARFMRWRKKHAAKAPKPPKVRKARRWTEA